MFRGRWFIGPAWGLGCAGIVAVLCPSVIHADPLSDAQLKVKGAVRSTAEGRTEQIGWLELSLPLEDLPESPGALAQLDVAQESRADSVGLVPLDPLEQDFVPEHAEPEADSGRSMPGVVELEDGELLSTSPVGPLLLVATLRAALHNAGLEESLDRLESMAGRARTSAILPDVRLRAGREFDQSLRLTPTEEDPYRYTQTDGANLLLEASLTWRLGALVFGSEELGLERLHLARERERQRLALQVLQALLDFNRAWLQVQVPRRRTGRARLSLFEATLRLDLLTGGWFSAKGAPVVLKPPSVPAPSRTPASVNSLANPPEAR